MRNSKNWLPQEDQALRIVCVERHIKKWTKISKILQEQFKVFDKNPKKCRQRFNNHINPQINREEWTKQEQHILMQYQRQIGNKWAEIARKLPGRTDNSVKNRFYSKIRHAIRAINEISSSLKIQKYREIKIGFIYKIMAVIDYKFRYQTSEVQENLIQLSQRLKNDILNFQSIEKSQQNVIRESLTRLFRNIQLINIYFKKKISKRRRSKFSKIVNNTQQIEQIQISMDEADIIQAEENMLQVKQQPQHQKTVKNQYFQTPPIKRSNRIKKQAGLIASVQSKKNNKNECKSSENNKNHGNGNLSNDPWGFLFFEQQHLDYYNHLH